MRLHISFLLFVSMNQVQTSAQDLFIALNRGDATAIQDFISQERTRLGVMVGEPEVADTYQTSPKDASWIEPSLAKRGFTPHFKRLKQLASAWKIGIDPTRMTEPLRAPASIVSGCVAVAKAGLDGSEECVTLATQLADFLIWTQEQAGAGCYPFPAAKDTSTDQAMRVATRFLNKAERANKLTEIVRNGWAFEDHEDGGLQFDNATCGIAIFDLYDLTKDQRYLNSARKAADWALMRPLCTNWNYNAFSVHLLAKAHAITKESRYLDAAVQKARFGVLPGQLNEGPHAGRWMDAHNARPAYHYIMMSALAQLTAELPQTHPDHHAIQFALKLGLTTRNTEFFTHGIMTKDKAMEALILIHKLFADDPSFIVSTQSDSALHILGVHVSEEHRRGKLPLGPRAWGEFLAHTVNR